MKKFNIIMQHDERDCGAACLAMVARHYGRTEELGFFVDLTKTDRAGSNIAGITEAAQSIGLDAKGMQGDYHDLRDSVNSGEIVLPLIVHTVSEQGYYHFVVIYRMDRRGVYIADPAKERPFFMPHDAFSEIWTGYVITCKKTDAFEEKKNALSMAAKFARLLKGQWGNIALVLILSLVMTYILVNAAFVFQMVLDGVTDEDLKQDTSGSVLVIEHIHEDDEDHDEDEEADIGQEIVKLCFFVLGSYLFLTLMLGIRTVIVAKMSRRIDHALIKNYLNKVLSMPVREIEKRSTGEYLTRLNDASTIRTAVSGIIMSLFLDITLMLIVLVFMFRFSVRMTLISLVVFTLYVATILLFNGPIRTASRDIMAKNAVLQSSVKEKIDGIETVKYYQGEAITEADFDHKVKDLLNSVFKGNLLYGFQNAVSEGISNSGTIIVIGIGFMLVYKGLLTVGQLVTYYILLSYFISPVRDLCDLQPTIQTASVSLDRLNDVLLSASEDTGGEEITADTLEIKDADFRYGARELCISDLCMSLRSGDHITILGENGSGKSTLGKLILKAYDLEDGQIVSGGVSWSDASCFSVRSKIAYIGEDTMLFSGSVMDNLMFGNTDITEEDVTSFMEKNGLSELIECLPGGYDCFIEENALNLSAGQKQKLMIARMLLRRPKILILDEATNNLDPESERNLMGKIISLLSDSIIIEISHRKTLNDNDSVAVMKNGKICIWDRYSSLRNCDDEYVLSLI